MFYLSRRNFLKKMIGVGSFFSLNVVFLNSFLEDFRSNFICEEFYLMGTKGKIQIFCDDLNYGYFVINKGLCKIKELESILTKFSPYSNVGMLNKNPFQFTQMSQEALDVFKIGNFISLNTFKYFDMGLGNLLSNSGIDSFVPIVGNMTKLNDLTEDLLIFDNDYVKLNRKNSMIDLGGIGKGYAIDECMKILLSSGIKHSAIEFGGDIRVYGGMPNSLPWRVSFDKSIGNFFSNDDYFFDINIGSIAISGNYLKKSVNNINHIINPFSLKSKNDYFFTVVLGEQAVICDALSTAFFNMDINLITESLSNFNGYKFKLYF